MVRFLLRNQSLPETINHNFIVNQLIQTKLIKFLQEELAVPATSIVLAMRHHQRDYDQLPIILWQYGLITIQQLDKIFDWLETA